MVFELICKLFELLVLVRLGFDNWFWWRGVSFNFGRFVYIILVIKLVVGKRIFDLGELNRIVYDFKRELFKEGIIIIKNI